MKVPSFSINSAILGAFASLLLFFVTCFALGQERYDWRYQGVEAGAHRAFVGVTTLPGGDVVTIGGRHLGSDAPAVVECMDAFGIPKWSVTPAAPEGGTAFAPAAVVSNASGEIFVAGTATYDSGLGFPVENVAVIKLAANGTVLGGSRIQSTSSSSVKALALRPDGSPMLLSSWNNATDIALARFNGSAALVWNTVYDSTTLDAPVAMGFNGSNETAVAVQGRSTTDSGRFVPRALKFSESGTLQWAFEHHTNPSIQANRNAFASDIAFAPSGRVYMVGHMTVTNNANANGLIGIYDAAGTSALSGRLVPSTFFQGTLEMKLHSVVVNASNEVLVAGTFRNAQGWRLGLLFYAPNNSFSYRLYEQAEPYASEPTGVRAFLQSDGRVRIAANTYSTNPNRSRAQAQLTCQTTVIGDYSAVSFDWSNYDEFPMGEDAFGWHMDGMENLFCAGAAVGTTYRTGFVGKLRKNPIVGPTFEASNFGFRALGFGTISDPDQPISALFGIPSPSTVEVTTPATHGSVDLNTTTNVLVYHNYTNLLANDSFGVRFAYGPGGRTTTGTRTGNVTIFGAPTGVNDVATTSEGVSRVVNVVANDLNLTGTTGPLRLYAPWLGTPSNGVALVTSANQIRYTPNLGFTGTDSFWYVARDIRGGLAFAEVTVHVTPGPVIELLNPRVITAGTGAQQVVVNGRNFGAGPGSIVRVNGVSRTTTWISENELRVDLLATDVASAGTRTLTVRRADGLVSAGAALAVGVPSLRLTAVRVIGQNRVELRIQNQSGASAENVRITSAALRGSGSVSPTLPHVVGSIPVGNTPTVVIEFPAAAFAAASGNLVVNLTHSAGTLSRSVFVRF
jgi:hypothetical protein